MEHVGGHDVSSAPRYIELSRDALNRLASA